jgi:DNA-binding MarR family transcriptional regulator
VNEARPVPGPTPVLGPQARAAAQLPTRGAKRRRLLILIAAYHDVGCHPSVRMLAGRSGLTTTAIVRLLDALRQDELLQVERRPSPQRDRYTLRTPREERP